MKLIKYIILIFITLLGLNYHALANTQTSTDKQFYDIMKYEKFENAINKFEDINKVKVETPSTFPFQVTHKFGKLQDNGYLDLYYYNETSKQWLKTIVINGSRNIDKIPTDQLVKVKNTNVVFRQNDKGYKLEFHKDNLTYVIFVSNKTSNFDKEDVRNIVLSLK